MESQSQPKRAARVPAYSGLAHSLRKAEASSRAEGVDPNTSPTYLYIKGLLLAGEITLDAAHEYLEDYSTPMTWLPRSFSCSPKTMCGGRRTTTMSHDRRVTSVSAPR